MNNHKQNVLHVYSVYMYIHVQYFMPCVHVGGMSWAGHDAAGLDMVGGQGALVTMVTM